MFLDFFPLLDELLSLEGFLVLLDDILQNQCKGLLLLLDFGGLIGRLQHVDDRLQAFSHSSQLPSQFIGAKVLLERSYISMKLRDKGDGY